ncbi:RsmB/NOP family class I SAM-dependent RNA methyltransferase [Lapidilactobacillus bayanensis]|uniref:RsmB/NOP family class I SAM-dependent RNA methyltransferase n=1 Tax=Lapidilactobacillus bayanensis TaxID=2485998 RepID=UPI000F7A9CB4|nr:RsmF rRNA methyltransferase first C-terminal domain-containing protein [Lapidilactobacillus bayanensis]
MTLPQAFIDKYQHLLGADADAFFAALQQPAVAGFRVNPRKVTAQLHQNFATNYQPVPWNPSGYYGKISGRDIAQLSGAIYSQEPSAQGVAALADPQPGMRVLDLCAAPGGKTTQLAGLLNGTGLLVANEIDRQRAKVLSENVERFGYDNVVVVNHDPDSLAASLPQFFDLIVIDAPCSGEGMFRKDPEAISYWSPDYVLQCQERQRNILKAALKMLRADGQIVYSTCTFAPEEDEENIDWLLQNYPALAVVTPPATWPGVDAGRPEWGHDNPALVGARRFWPQHVQGEGHFMVKLQADGLVVKSTEPKKLATNSRQTKKDKRTVAPNNTRLNQTQQKLFDQFVEQTYRVTPDWTRGNLQLQKDQLFVLPAELNELTNLKYVRRGLWLGEFRKNRFVPNHALIMASTPEQLKTVIDLNMSQYQQYVHGDVIRLTTTLTKGWYGVSYQKQIYSWGYLVEQTLKNFYPKGLRF